MNSFTALHIGTAKFYYPLNLFFRKSTSDSLRKFDDIEKREECFNLF